MRSSPVMLMTVTSGLYAGLVHGWIWGVLVTFMMPLSVPIFTLLMYLLIYKNKGEEFIRKIKYTNWFINLQAGVFAVTIILIYLTNSNF